MRLHLVRSLTLASVAFLATAAQAHELGAIGFKTAAKETELEGKAQRKLDAQVSAQAQLFMEQKDAPQAQAQASKTAATALRTQVPTRLSTKSKD